MIRNSNYAINWSNHTFQTQASALPQKFNHMWDPKESKSTTFQMEIHTHTHTHRDTDKTRI